jgi:cell division protein FtsI (penicillin-binding protein 3)
MGINRHKVILNIFLVMVICILIRLSYLQIIERAFLNQQSTARTTRSVEVPANRGNIYDRNGEPLAVSTQVHSVWVNPKIFAPTKEQLDALCKILKTKPLAILNKINPMNSAGKEFVYLKRHLPPHEVTSLQKLNITGLNLKPEYKRFYPVGEITAHIVGFTNIDDLGQEGSELVFNDWLQGVKGKKIVVKDCLGREVEKIKTISNHNMGNDVTLSVDQRLQYVSYKALKDAIIKHNALSGSAVVINIATGEVLALVNQPTFNPNVRTWNKNNSHIYRNLAVTDSFEPGSVIKAFSMASILENTTYGPHSKIDTHPGSLRLPGGVVRDIADNGVIDATTVMLKSSNIGIVKMMAGMTPRQLWDTYDRFGFGWDTESHFPGESSGYLSLPGKEQSFVAATMSFGYGLTTTPLQLARAFAILGSGGIRRPISFIKLDKQPEGVRVVEQKVAQQVVEMLVSSGNNEHSNARVTGFVVAGKTGTVRKLGNNGYEHGKHRAVFGGLVPAHEPKFAIVVVINEPSNGEYYSNQVAAPIFSKIAFGALRLYNVAPNVGTSNGVLLSQNAIKKNP